MKFAHTLEERKVLNDLRLDFIRQSVVIGTFVSVWFNKINFSFKADKRQEIRNFTENFLDETLLTFDNIYFSYAAVSYRTRKREL